MMMLIYDEHIFIRSQVIYAWARDAPALDLPDGVAFEVGGNTAIQYIVLQVHYADVSSFEGIHSISVLQ